ncbi:MAG TPA: M48 family metallopeptidase [Terriglobales bacterium]|nr:M48 family metallopeptidase [Terriglobales bacterium]
MHPCVVRRVFSPNQLDRANTNAADRLAWSRSSLVCLLAAAGLTFASAASCQIDPKTASDNLADRIVRAASLLRPHSANPFSAPWLMDFELIPKSAEQPSLQLLSPSTTPPALPRSTYKLKPDPFNSELQQSASTDDAPSTLSSQSPHTDTAQQVAAGQKVEKKRHRSAKALGPRYDIARIGDRGVGDKLNFYSLDKEEALGRELSQQVEQQAKLIKDPIITEYVNRVGQTLVQHSDAKVPFVIKVVDDEQVNAFALPGGFFYVNTGVLLAADNEAELAGIMAHEIAHVAARHATRNATKQEIWNLASIPLIFVGGPVTAAIRQAAGLMVPMSFLKFSRDAEREADFLGLEYEYAAGYDPAAFIDFFERLDAREKQKTGFIARAFSTHPMNDDRIRRAEEELTMLPARNDYILSTSEFDQVKSHLIRVTRGRAINDGKTGPTLRKHTVEDDKPPVLRRKSGTLTPNLP